MKTYTNIQAAAVAADQKARKTGDEWFVVYEPDELDRMAYHICDVYDLDGYFCGARPVYSTADYVSA